MATPSQSSYASRLARAEQFYQFINEFKNFDPGIEELTPTAFHQLIEGLTLIQTGHTISHNDYAEAAKERKKVFISNPKSISKSLTRVNAFLKASKGKDSQQYIGVNTLIKKIRGERPSVVTINSTEITISRSERSYGSQLQNFADIIALLEHLETAYAPNNLDVTLATLLALHEEATLLTNKVSVTFWAYKPQIKERQEGFRILNQTANRIKEMVKYQYGVDSPEYKHIRKFNFNANV